MQIINNKLFNNIQQAELAKALEDLDQLYRTQIGALLARGNAVDLTVVLEVPDHTKFFNDVAGVRDTGDLISYKGMHVTGYSPMDDNPHPLPDKDGPPSMRSAGEAVGPAEWDEVWDAGHHIKARETFHIEHRKLTLRPENFAIPRRGSVIYRPKLIQVRRGSQENAQRYGLNRGLRIPAPDDVHSGPYGWSTLENRPYLLGPLVPAFVHELPTLWMMGDMAKPEYRIHGHMQYLGTNREFILEHATGEDLDPQWSAGSTWEAEILWERE
jgi:hypothetical protein